MAEISDLNITDASNTARFPEGMAFSSVNDSARALEGILARWFQDTNGSIVSGGSSNAYTLAAKQTISAYAQGQVFMFEANHANTGAATLNVDSVGAKAIKKHNDQALASGDIESGQIVLVAYEGAADAFQMLSPLGNAPVSDVVDDTTPQLGGPLDTNSNIVKWSKGADVASATSLTLGTDGNYFDITGTTTITSIGTLGIGTVVKLHFDGALTLTHHATDLILPGGANITTAAGDEAEFVEYASGDWRCLNYQRAETFLEQTTGTWTPSITFATAGDLSVAYSTQAGTYAKIGDLVFGTFSIVTSTFTHSTASGNLSISTLPFTSANVTGNEAYGVMRWAGINKASYTQIVSQIGANSTDILLRVMGMNETVDSIDAADMPSGGTVTLIGSIVYRAA